MATSARNHVVPAALETPRRQAISDLAASINDFVVVANATERAQKASDLGATSSRPLVVYRQDARVGFEFEYTTNGTTWRTIAPSTKDGAQLVWQGGSFVGSTAVNGTMNLTFNTPFTASTLTVLASPGSTAGGLASVAATGVPTLTGVQVVCYNPSGAVLNGQTVRINWAALGF